MITSTKSLQPQQTPVASHHIYKNIIFDLGGVLVKFDPIDILKKLMPEKTSFECKSFFITTLFPALKDYDKGMKADELIEKYGKTLDVAMFKQFLIQTLEELQPIDVAMDILDAVKQKGFKVYILSNLSSKAYEKLSAIPNFFSKFDGTIFSYQVNCAKPDPAIFQELLKQHNLKAEECFFIDDMQMHIDGAKKCGIDGVVCSNHEQLKQDLITRNIL